MKQLITLATIALLACCTFLPTFAQDKTPKKQNSQVKQKAQLIDSKKKSDPNDDGNIAGPIDPTQKSNTKKTMLNK